MIKLGEMVKDRITGFEGVADARSVFLYGCVRVCVQPKALKDGVPIEGQWFDEQRLDVTSKAKTGGPGTSPTRRSGPARRVG